MKKKRVKKFTDRGFGFPVILEDVPMVKVRGSWVPDINYAMLAVAVFSELSRLDGRLTGNQVRFIRLQLSMTLQEFAARLRVTHPAVLKWEKKGDSPTGMSWSTEKDIRLLVGRRGSDSTSNFIELYDLLENIEPKKRKSITLEAADLAA